MAPVLLNRVLDPLLGVFTGVFAYYLYENHPRTAIPQDEKLSTLVEWKWSKYRQAREKKLHTLEQADWTSDTLVGTK